MHKTLHHKQQGWVLIVNLVVMALLTSLMMSLWQQVTQQGQIVKHDKKAYQRRQALQQWAQQVNKHFIQQHPDCQADHPICSTKIKTIKLDYDWQQIATLPCYALHNHPVEVDQLEINIAHQNGVSARMMVWLPSHKTIKPQRCSHSPIKLKQSHKSWLLKPA